MVRAQCMTFGAGTPAQTSSGLHQPWYSTQVLMLLCGLSISVKSVNSFPYSYYAPSANFWRNSFSRTHQTPEYFLNPAKVGFCVCQFRTKRESIRLMMHNSEFPSPGLYNEKYVQRISMQACVCNERLIIRFSTVPSHVVDCYQDQNNPC